jgi:hypothetical protein
MGACFHAQQWCGSGALRQSIEPTFGVLDRDDCRSANTAGRKRPFSDRAIDRWHRNANRVSKLANTESQAIGG